MAESSAALWLERTTFVGGFLEAVLWGMQVVLYFTCVCLLYQRRRDMGIRWLQFIYTTIMFCSGTINLAANTNYRQLAWIEDRDTFPGGPAAFIASQWNIPVSLVSTASFVICNILADALMLWRCFLVWNAKLWVMILPALAFLATTALSIVSVYTASQPGNNLDAAVNTAIPYFALSMGTNLMLSLLIAGRVLAMRRKILRLLGEQHAKPYTSVVSTVVESAALYSAVGLAFLITYAINNSAQNVLLPVLLQVMCIASELIVLRVAYGRAWSQDVMSLQSRSLRSLRPGARERQSRSTEDTLVANRPPHRIIELRPIQVQVDIEGGQHTDGKPSPVTKDQIDIGGSSALV